MNLKMVAAVNEEGAAGARGFVGFVLIGDGPGGVQLVFVDDDGGYDDGYAKVSER